MNTAIVITIVFIFLIVVVLLVMASYKPITPPVMKPMLLASVAASQIPHNNKPPINITIKPQHPTSPDLIYVPVSQKPYYSPPPPHVYTPPPHVYNPPSQTNPPPNYNNGGYGGGGASSGPPPPPPPPVQYQPVQTYPQLNYGGVSTMDISY